MHRLRIQDLMTARICALLANTHRAKESDKIFSPADFSLFPPEARGPGSPPPARPAPVVWDEHKQLEALERMNKLFGGRDNRRPRPSVENN